MLRDGSSCASRSADRRSTQPTTPAMKGCSLGEREQPACFFEGLTHLDGDAGVDPSRAHLARRVLRQEVAPQRGHVVVDPAVSAGVVPPEMHE